MSDVIITEFHGGYNNMMLWQRFTGTTDHYGTAGGIFMIAFALALAWIGVAWARKVRARRYLAELQEEIGTSATPDRDLESLCKKREVLLSQLKATKAQMEVDTDQREELERRYQALKKELAQIIYVLKRLGVE